MSRIPIGPISIDDLNFTSIIEKIETVINKGIPSQIVTLNSLMFNFTLKDKNLSDAINNAAIVIADSVGITWAAKFLQNKKINRFPGIDLIYHLCGLAVKKEYTMYFLGARPGIVEQATEKLKNKYPNLKIIGMRHGYFSENEEPEIFKKIKSLKPDILLLGYSIPKQEKWISSNLQNLGVPIVMGIGGSFDVLSGKLKRAPVLMQKLGLEWMFRFIQQPWRIVRIINLPFFVLHIIAIKIRNMLLPEKITQ